MLAKRFSGIEIKMQPAARERVEVDYRSLNTIWRLEELLFVVLICTVCGPY